MDSIQAVKDLIETPDFKRAQAIGNECYEGARISDDDQAFYNAYVDSLLGKDDLPFAVGIWLLFATKYTT